MFENRKSKQIERLTKQLREQVDARIKVEDKVAQLEREHFKEFRFTITPVEDGFEWQTYKTRRRLGRYDYGPFTEYLDDGKAKTAVSAETKARKALIPYQLVSAQEQTIEVC